MSTHAAKLGLAIAAGAGIALMLAAVASANDTSLNLSVDPPRLLGEDLAPVQMAAEHIAIHFGKERTKVEVEFTFRNLSDEELDCWAGFPDEDLLYRYLWSAAGSPDDMSGVDALAERYGLASVIDSDTAGKVENFEAWTRPAGEPGAASTPLECKVIRIESLASTLAAPQDEPAVKAQWTPMDANSLLLCRAFQLHFAPKQELIVGHRYDAATGSNVESQALFQYQLITGRNWQGPIGEAVIDVYLEPDVAGLGLYFGSAKLPGYYPVTKPGQDELQRIVPGHYRLVWRNFEPEGEKGWVFLATPPREVLQPAGAGTAGATT